MLDRFQIDALLVEAARRSPRRKARQAQEAYADLMERMSRRECKIRAAENAKALGTAILEVYSTGDETYPNDPV